MGVAAQAAMGVAEAWQPWAWLCRQPWAWLRRAGPGGGRRLMDSEPYGKPCGHEIGRTCFIHLKQVTSEYRAVSPLFPSLALFLLRGMGCWPARVAYYAALASTRSLFRPRPFASVLAS
jgi:hypothetical protein